MSWEKIIKETDKTFNSLAEIVDWMVKNKVKNHKSIKVKFEQYKNFTSNTFDYSNPNEVKVEINSTQRMALEQLSPYIVRNLRKEWLRLLDAGKFY